MLSGDFFNKCTILYSITEYILLMNCQLNCVQETETEDIAMYLTLYATSILLDISSKYLLYSYNEELNKNKLNYIIELHKQGYDTSYIHMIYDILYNQNT